MILSPLRQPLAASLLATVGLLAGCSNVGDGNKPESLRIVLVNQGTEVVEGVTLYRCTRSSLVLLAQFTNGGFGNYSNRARWSSDNPAVVRVSNFDEPVPGDDDQFFVHGTITPVLAGASLPADPAARTATIRAEYLGLTASIDVTLEDPTDLRLLPENQTLAPESLQVYTVTGKIDDVELSLNSNVSFALAEENDEVATLNENTAIITAVAPGAEPLQLNASFDVACPTPTLSVPVPVAAIDTLELRREEGFSGELVDDTTELYRAVARFADGSEQNLTGQARTLFRSATPTVANFIGSGTLLAIAPGSTELKVEFGTQPDEEENEPGSVVASAPQTLTVVAPLLTAISVTPETATIDALTTQAFRAVGTYDDQRTQDITRHVVWSSSDATKVTISGGVSLNAGIAVSRTNEAATVTLTAGNTATNPTVSDTATLTVVPVEDEEEDAGGGS